MLNYLYLCWSIPTITAMQQEQTFYDRLCISSTASDGEIRRAYHMRARELHPDKSPDPQATQLFQALVEAYETLKDPELRYMYDATLEEKHLACSRCLTLKN